MIFSIRLLGTEDSHKIYPSLIDELAVILSSNFVFLLLEGMLMGNQPTPRHLNASFSFPFMDFEITY